jgi:acetyl esterase/lipase
MIPRAAIMTCNFPREAMMKFTVCVVAAITAGALGPARGETDLPTYDHADLSYVLRGNGQEHPIQNAGDWRERRKHIVAGMQRVMGSLPRPVSPVVLDVRTVEEQREPSFTRRKLAYHTDDPQRRVHAWLLIPRNGDDDGSTQRRPAMLCLHQTTTAGKDSPVGLADRPTLHYARELAERGYVTLSPDYPSLGEHQHDFDSDRYESGSMKAIYDNIRAIDLLASLPEVDPERIGAIGHSLGGHNSLFTAVFDERIKAVVTSCGFTSFQKYKGGDVTGWTGPRYMPLIETRYGKQPERMPFNFPEVLAAIAPRGVFVVAPINDDNFDVSGVRDCVAAASPIFNMLGAADRLQVVYPDAAHDFPDAQRAEAYAFVDKTFNAE